MWRGIYRDDRLFVLNGKISISEIRIWRDKFQERVDKITGNNYLQFTCENWNPGVHPSTNREKFPFM